MESEDMRRRRGRLRDVTQSTACESKCLLVNAPDLSIVLHMCVCVTPPVFLGSRCLRGEGVCVCL